MRFYIMTLVSFIVVLTLRSYTNSAQLPEINDSELTTLAKIELLNKQDSLRHRKMIKRFVGNLDTCSIVYGQFRNPNFELNASFKDYSILCETATKEELFDIIRDSNTVLKVYSFKALSSKGIPLPSNIKFQLLADTNTFVYANGLDVRMETVKDLVREHLFTELVQGI